MTTDRLRQIAEREAREHLRDFWRVNLVECYGDTLTDAEIDEVLRMIREDARIPAPPRIIRTREELAALDPDTVLFDVDDPWREVRMSASEWMEDYAIDAEGIFPLAVIATGEHVRAARQALKEAGE